jgi:hypothetical protein
LGRALLLANSFIILMLFLYHEGFYLLPESMTILPGVFRMSDAFFVIIPFFAFGVFKTFSRYREESMMVISFCTLMLIGCLVGQFFFPQTFFDGLLNVRRNLFWLSFFVYIPLIRNLDRAESLLKLLTILVGVYVVILLLTKNFPYLGLIYYPEIYYNIKGGLKRFGEFRFFFPYGSIPIMFYFIVLAKMIHGTVKANGTTWFFRFLFLMIVMSAVMSSYTRGVVFPVLIVSAVAFFSIKKRILKYAAVAIVTLLVSFQVLSKAMDEEGGSIIEDTKLGKMVLKTGQLSPEEGRKLQVTMYLTQFMRSPITGVGTFAVTRFAKYKDVGVMQSYKAYGYFGASDLGYLKVLGDYGLLGIVWVIWFYTYIFLRGRQTLAKAQALGGIPTVEVLTRGLLYFTLYLLISGVTLPYWIHPLHITLLPLLLALMAILRVSVNEMQVADKNTSLQTPV